MRLRDADMRDAHLLFDWKNDRAVRKAAILTDQKIDWKGHLKWLEKNVDYIQIIEVGGRPVGDVRITKDEVAIKIDPKFRGKGIALSVLRRVSKKGMTAKIVPSNIASMNLFFKAGFIPMKFKGTHYIFTRV